jgi:tetratricopeptide (TPR) repeat protein
MLYRLSMRHLVLTVLMIIGLAGPAVAQPPETWARCANEGGSVSPDVIIVSCSALISSGLETQAKLAIAYTNRGATYRIKGDYDRAIADHTKAIEIDAKNVYYYNNRGWAYFKAGKAAQGLPDAEKALQSRPNDAILLNTRGHIFEALGRREEAIADFPPRARAEP